MNPVLGNYHQNLVDFHKYAPPGIAAKEQLTSSRMVIIEKVARATAFSGEIKTL